MLELTSEQPQALVTNGTEPVRSSDSAFVKWVGEELDELARLRPNWDGYGAPVIDPGVIAAAREFIAVLSEQIVSRPCVVPISGGNLQFEWHCGPKLLELEFETAQTIHFLQWHPEAGIEVEATFAAADTRRAVDLLQWVAGGTSV